MSTDRKIPVGPIGPNHETRRRHVRTEPLSRPRPTDPAKVFVITMSLHYDYTSVGRTKDEAMMGLRKVWNRQSTIKWATFTRIHDGSTPADYYGAHVHELAMGEGEQS